MNDEVLSPSTHPGPGLPRLLNILFAWSVWAVMLGTNLVAIYRYSPQRMPMSDELQQLGGGANMNWGWLWEQHAEHRIPLAKFIWLGMLQITDYDFRIGNLVEVAAVGLVALVMMLAARRVRGETRWTDAFFPLVLLNFGQTYPVFLWWWQVNHTLPPLLACLLLVLIAASPRPSTANLFLSGVLLVLLALSGPGGLPYVPPLALWLSWSAFRSDSTVLAKWAIFGLILAAGAFTSLYFVRFDPSNRGLPPAAMTAEGAKSALRTSAQLLSVSLGTKTEPQWKAWGALVAAFWLCGVLLALAAAIRKPSERMRAVGLLLFLCGSAGLILVMGWARAKYPDANTFEGHYLTKGVPALCCVYLVFEILGRARTAGEFHGCMLAGAIIPCVFLVFDHKQLLDAADRRLHATYEMADDLNEGVSAYVWYQKHKVFQGLESENPYVVARHLQHLRDLGARPFVNLRDEKEVPIASEPARVNEISRSGDIFEMTGSDPSMIFSLDRPRHVVAIVIRITYLDATERPAQLQLYWKNSDQGFGEDRSFVINVTADGREQTIAVPVNATIDGFRLDPDSRPGKFRISEMVLLVPDPARAGQ